jgi:hypothetical protein
MANALRDTLLLARLDIDGDQPIESDYRFVWLGRLGPTAMWLLVWCNRLTQMASATTVRVSTEDLAVTLGVKRQMLAHAFERLVRLRFAQASAAGFLVRGGLPVLRDAAETPSASAQALHVLSGRSNRDEAA